MNEVKLRNIHRKLIRDLIQSLVWWDDSIAPKGEIEVNGCVEYGYQVIYYAYASHKPSMMRDKITYLTALEADSVYSVVTEDSAIKKVELRFKVASDNRSKQKVIE